VKFTATRGATLLALAVATAPAVASTKARQMPTGSPTSSCWDSTSPVTIRERAAAWCSGFVVSDQVVLTAAHCVVSLPRKPDGHLRL
jgi:hypothetical protein